jgi:hypothetical protein
MNQAKSWVLLAKSLLTIKNPLQSLKGTVAQDFLAPVFSWIYSIWALDFEAKRIFFSFRFCEVIQIFR